MTCITTTGGSVLSSSSKNPSTEAQNTNTRPTERISMFKDVVEGLIPISLTESCLIDDDGDIPISTLHSNNPTRMASPRVQIPTDSKGKCMADECGIRSPAFNSSSDDNKLPPYNKEVTIHVDTLEKKLKEALCAAEDWRLQHQQEVDKTTKLEHALDTMHTQNAKLQDTIDL